MSLIENYIENYCEKFDDCIIEYCIEDGNFYYDMHEQYEYEMLITFPLNSSQTLNFFNGLNEIFDKKDNVYWTENWGEESNCEVDRIWIWW